MANFKKFYRQEIILAKMCDEKPSDNAAGTSETVRITMQKGIGENSVEMV